MASDNYILQKDEKHRIITPTTEIRYFYLLFYVLCTYQYIFLQVMHTITIQVPTSHIHHYIPFGDFPKHGYDCK